MINAAIAFLPAASLVLLCALALGCNRAAARIPGASLPFPSISTHYVARQTNPFTLTVALPIDRRASHYGERVAGTRWTGCETDPFWTTDAPSIVRDRLVEALRSSKLFANVSQAPPAPGDLVLRSEIDAFCSQVIGFLFGRVAGISALGVAVEQNGQALFEQKFERVVTDADAEYTGTQVGFIEQAMQVTMADSLRELLSDLLAKLDQEAPGWKVAAEHVAPDTTQ